jgi:hypothetical protein
VRIPKLPITGYPITMQTTLRAPQARQNHSKNDSHDMAPPVGSSHHRAGPSGSCGLGTVGTVDFVLHALVDALSWLLVPKSTWGFIVRAAAVIVLVLLLLGLT